MAPMRSFTVAASMAAVLALAACGTTTTGTGSTSAGTSTTTSTPRSTATAQYGVVQSINIVRGEEDKGIGAGAVVGGVIGGVLGNQVGKGSGNTAATVLGAAGGAYAGHQVEKNRREAKPDQVELVVRLYDGYNITVTQPSAADIRVGDRVVVSNGMARRY